MYALAEPLAADPKRVWKDETRDNCLTTSIIRTLRRKWSVATGGFGGFITWRLPAATNDNEVLVVSFLLSFLSTGAHRKHISKRNWPRVGTNFIIGVHAGGGDPLGS